MPKGLKYATDKNVEDFIYKLRQANLLPFHIPVEAKFFHCLGLPNIRRHTVTYF